MNKFIKCLVITAVACMLSISSANATELTPEIRGKMYASLAVCSNYYDGVNNIKHDAIDSRFRDMELYFLENYADGSPEQTESLASIAPQFERFKKMPPETLDMVCESIYKMLIK
ncbi:hypothetical protein FCV43_18480 [Vibrio genomosp. F6]|uniref:hypothetical protein n=1 Tax=Vibrio genomosp. F6 TaxID=723172 RepID=UPI0010BD9E23|nr:hypothetical protein [Vibrio genomosp. F6]TKF16251.1 hypothetical protein FCV43_18480 [Vibrio genomosp. F6]